MWNTNSFVILQILHNSNCFEMWHLNSDVGLHTLTTWTILKCKIVIHLLFYKCSTIQTTLKCRIVIHLLFLHIFHKINCCEIKDLPIVLVQSMLILPPWFKIVSAFWIREVISAQIEPEQLANLSFHSSWSCGVCVKIINELLFRISMWFGLWSICKITNELLFCISK
jgi:hypothetical protein